MAKRMKPCQYFSSYLFLLYTVTVLLNNKINLTNLISLIREESASQNIESDYTIISTAPPAQLAPTAGPKKAACNMCGADFPSKTKLFNHLQETGHSIKKEFVPKPAQKPTGNKKGKKGRRR